MNRDPARAAGGVGFNRPHRPGPFGSLDCWLRRPRKGDGMTTRFAALVWTVTVLLAAVGSSAAELPAGTHLPLRLLTEVSSEQPAASHVRAVLVAPVIVDGSVRLPAGVTFSGKTEDVVSARAGSDRAASLKLNFERVEDASGHSQKVACRVIEVDNARETVDETGRVIGITPSETVEAQIDKGIDKVAARNQALADLLGGIRSAVVKQVDPSITFPAGVDLTLELTEPLDWTGSSELRNAPGSIEPVEGLEALVNAEPARTVAASPPRASDLTNLMFLGSEDVIRRAFTQAGWSTAAQLDADSKLETARAIIEDRGYKEAPVSILLLDGRPPDLVFQKQTDTFAKRDHIRIWRRPETFAGKRVWVAAATHDIGIDYSQESHTFTHKVDSNIDLERAKVVADLVFSGLVHGVELIDRNNLPTSLSNATGDILKTDGRIAVLAF